MYEYNQIARKLLENTLQYPTLQINEAPEEIEDKKGQASDGVSGEGSAMFNQQQYHVGDFVYVANKEMPGGEPKIFLIEKIYRTNPHLSNGVWMMAVNQFFRYNLKYVKF